MKLIKALKIKNRVAGDLARAQEIFRRENSRRDDDSSKVDRTEAWNVISSKKAELIRIKTAITKANVGIYHALAEMEELKGMIRYVQLLDTREGEEVSYEGMNAQKVTYVWTAQLNQEAVDGLITHYQNRLNELQDEVDEYNATTDVEI